MDWNAFWSGIAGAGLGTVVGGSVLGLLLQSMIDHRLSSARDVAAEGRAKQEKIREESRAVAEILSEWTRYAYTGQFSNEDRWRMQSVYWKNILGLDHRLISLLFPRLANEKDAKSVGEIIVHARAILLGLKEPDILAAQLNNWVPEDGPQPTALPESAG